MKKLEIRQMTLIGLMAALLCIVGPFSVPLPFTPVPISLTNLAVYFTAFALGCKLGTVSYMIYLLLGTAGLPVFSAFSGGLSKLAGPTGGYLIGFILTAAICGFFVDRSKGKRSIQFAGMILGTLTAYLFGTVWLCSQMHLTPIQGLAAGVIPYLPGDFIKIVLALAAGNGIRQTVKKTAAAVS
ncbi:biotin transporter BioY [Anaerostipes sp.]|uniref:biotin transporter BioY n=1 Tax=Anaerostipes sp. TaxID=1872530 RepID=UPI0025C2C30D|nr:biotin transporter BioY [Anaerostipes sp.]MBS7008271.1 biotin transporter BioY [Anaerostipes sp.]